MIKNNTYYIKKVNKEVEQRLKENNDCLSLNSINGDAESPVRALNSIRAYNGDEMVLDVCDENIASECFDLLNEAGIVYDGDLSNVDWKNEQGRWFKWFKLADSYLMGLFIDNPKKCIIYLNTFRNKAFSLLGYGNEECGDTLKSNEKLSNGISCLNMWNAISCPYRIDNTCQFCEDCYALNLERMRPNITRNWTYRALWFFITPITDICRAIVQKGNRTIRMDEYGEIFELNFQIEKFKRILEILPMYSFTIYTKSRELIEKAGLLDYENLTVRYSGEDEKMFTYTACHLQEALDLELGKLCPCSFKFENWNCKKCSKCYGKEHKDLVVLIHDEFKELPIKVSPTVFVKKSLKNVTLRDYLKSQGWNGSEL